MRTIVSAALSACVWFSAGFTPVCFSQEQTLAPEEEPQTEETTVDDGFSDAAGGLRIRLEFEDGPHHIGDSVTCSLQFRNVTSEPIRTYLVTGEWFRALQSTLFIKSSEGGDILSMQPEPQPHGIVVGEEDFHLIEPNSEVTFIQTLHLRPELGDGGTLWVEWTYENQVERWEGGRMTMDGPTVELFGGEDIPYIWLGTVSVGSPIEVVP